METGAKINCSPGNVGLTVPLCAFPPEAITDPYMVNEACVGSVVGDDLGRFSSFFPCKSKMKNQFENLNSVFRSSDSDDCKLMSDGNGTHLIYETSVTWQEGKTIGIISRISTIKIDFKCAMEIKYSKSLDSGFSPMLAMTDVQLEHTEGKFQLGMGLWSDETFSTPLAADAVINVPEPLFVGIVFENGGENLFTTLERCWATPR